MKFFLCIFALMAYASADDSLIADSNPIGIEKVPYQINLMFRKHLLPFVSYNHLCSGSIYSDRVIIIAAHCIIQTNPRHYRVVAGSIYRNGNSGFSAKVQQIIVNENYNSNSHVNDIAILILKNPLPLNNRTMRAIQLAEQDPIEGEMATTSGWGAMSQFDDDSDILREVQLPIVSNKVCNVDFKRRIFASMICAGYRGAGGSKDCQEDNSAPLVANGKLVGVLSWGMGCALTDYPGVYARISYLRPWIMQKINSL